MNARASGGCVIIKLMLFHIESTEQVPPEDLHITITTQSLTSLQSVQSSSLPANQPSWWSDPIPPLQLPPPPSPAQSMASTSIAASPIVGKKRKPSVVTPVKDLGGFGKDRVVMPGFRRITAQDDILPDEKRRTRGAEVCLSNSRHAFQREPCADIVSFSSR